MKRGVFLSSPNFLRSERTRDAPEKKRRQKGNSDAATNGWIQLIAFAATTTTSITTTHYNNIIDKATTKTPRFYPTQKIYGKTTR